MTRRGTLAYYLAAWVIGCFVVAFLQWLGETIAGNFRTASILLTTYFFALIFGAIAILLFAFLLRRSMRLLRTHAVWAWSLWGATLAFLEILSLIHAQSALLSFRSGEFGEVFFAACLKPSGPLAGPNPWRAPPPGRSPPAGPSLCLLHRLLPPPPPTPTA